MTSIRIFPAFSRTKNHFRWSDKWIVDTLYVYYAGITCLVSWVCVHWTYVCNLNIHRVGIHVYIFWNKLYSQWASDLYMYVPKYIMRYKGQLMIQHLIALQVSKCFRINDFGLLFLAKCLQVQQYGQQFCLLC